MHLSEGIKDEAKKEQAEYVVLAIMRALEKLEQDSITTAANGHPEGEALKERLIEALGEVIGNKVFESGRQSLVNAVLERDVEI